MKKIVIISNSIWNIYNFRRKLVSELSKNYEVHILTSSSKNIPKSFLKNINLHNIMIERRGINIFTEIKLIFLMLKKINRIKPDLLLNYTIKPVIYGSLISRFLNIKTINTITGLGRVFIVKKLFLLKYLIIFLYRCSLKTSKINFFHNSEDLNFFIKKKISNRENSLIMNGSGVDLDEFKYTKPVLKNHQYNFLTISRLTSEKGIYDLIKSIKIIKKNFSNCTFTIIGQLEKFNQGGISIQQINNWENKDLIQYQGFAEDVKKFIISCDALIHPSHREGSSRSIQEAMAIGRPIIASDCKGNIETVKNNFNGLVFKAKDYLSLSNKIKYYINLKNDKKMNLSLNSRNTAELKFNQKDIVAQYLKYVNLLI